MNRALMILEQFASFFIFLLIFCWICPNKHLKGAVVNPISKIVLLQPFFYSLTSNFAESLIALFCQLINGEF